jgi:hypothetical protein
LEEFDRLAVESRSLILESERVLVERYGKVRVDAMDADLTRLVRAFSRQFQAASRAQATASKAVQPFGAARVLSSRRPYVAEPCEQERDEQKRDHQQHGGGAFGAVENVSQPPLTSALF